MKTCRFVVRTSVLAPREELFGWHMRAGALERLIPPWEPVEVLERPVPITEGSRAVLRVRVGPVRRRWIAVHRDLEPDRQFRDVQVRGPFRHWVHTHRFHAGSGSSSVLEDDVEYAVPLGAIGRVLADGFTRKKLARMFCYRHAVTVSDLERHRGAALDRPLRVAVTGASGLVGSALVPFLTAGGHHVVRLVRRAAEADDEIEWNPDEGRVDAARLEGIDAVVHLAGENVASGRWTHARKSRIRDSRVRGTRSLAGTLAGLDSRPKVLVSSSAVGYYGDRGDRQLDESSDAGTGFLADVCRDWEAATEEASRAGIRVVLLRTGVVLSAAGGALARMLPPFRWGVGGRLGDGRQFVSWIALDDLIGAIHFALTREELSGPVNATAPSPVSNERLTRTLAGLLRRPAVFPVPGWVLRAALGEMAEEMLLASTRVLPRRLESAGFVFRHPELEGALRFGLGLSGGSDRAGGPGVTDSSR